MTEYKNNHYVPQWLLKRFMSDKGELFYFDKNRPEKPIQHRDPSKVFCEANLYVDIDKTGKRDVSLESEVYSELDNNAKLVTEKIVAAARKSLLPQLSDDEKLILDQFMFQQWQRTPDAQVEFNKAYNFEDEYRTSLEKYEKQVRPLNAFEKLIMDGALTKNRLHNSARILNLKRDDQVPVWLLGSRGLGIAKVSDSRTSYIVGSFPVVRLSYDGKTLADPTTEVWLPIAHDVIITPSGKKHEEKLVELDRAKVRKMNELICKQSSKIASRSREVLCSLLSGT
jgi:hypothetical protein